MPGRAVGFATEPPALATCAGRLTNVDWLNPVTLTMADETAAGTDTSLLGARRTPATVAYWCRDVPKALPTALAEPFTCRYSAVVAVTVRLRLASHDRSALSWAALAP